MNAAEKFYQFGHFGNATHRGDKEVGNALERSAILHRYEAREMENIVEVVRVSLRTVKIFLAQY